MATDIDVLIIGAGMSGLGLAVQLVQKYNFRRFVIIEKARDIGGTWFANTYPGCGCDVPSHFYSYSFALNPDWPRMFSSQADIQAYFRAIAEQHSIVPHTRFQTEVKQAQWDEKTATWKVTIRHLQSEHLETVTCKALISAVGSLSVPNECNISGHESFKGPLFHSAKWDSGFDWSNKNVAVIGNGCSATQFVPIMTAQGPNGQGQPVKHLTQFSRQAQFLAQRENPVFSARTKALMRYVPGLMRAFRGFIYVVMERDFGSFYIDSGASTRAGFKTTNEAYVKSRAPEKYWSHLIPSYEIGCKRKILDTDYLATLHRPNMTLQPSDPISHIVSDGIVTQSGAHIPADAIVLATGFQTHKLLAPMTILNDHGVSLSDHWTATYNGTPQAYHGTVYPSFPNFFTLMGPNTVTGHLSVIFTSESQISMILSLLEPILFNRSASLLPSLPSSIQSIITGAKQPDHPRSVSVTPAAADKYITAMQTELKKLVWSSGCTSWALDPETGLNMAMYPGYQFAYWLRCCFVKKDDFEYDFGGLKGGFGWENELGMGRKRKIRVGAGWKVVRRVVWFSVFLSAVLAWRRKGRLGLGEVLERLRLAVLTARGRTGMTGRRVNV